MKTAKRKTSRSKAPKASRAKKPAAKNLAAKKPAAKKPGAAAALDFNHAMIYSRDLSRAVEFYRDLLGLTMLEDFRAGDRIVYARLKAANNGTIALHLLEPGARFEPGAVRLYFEIRQLEKFCQRLEAAGAKFSRPPAMMPWGWTHAYLDDPDGHEVSLYWAGSKRLKKGSAK